jgi:hypothetical protein
MTEAAAFLRLNYYTFAGNYRDWGLRSIKIPTKRGSKAKNQRVLFRRADLENLVRKWQE